MNDKLKAAIKVLKDVPYTKEFSDARHIILLTLSEYDVALQSIKAGKYMEAPRHSYGDYTPRKFTTLKQVQEYAALTLKRERP